MILIDFLSFATGSIFKGFGNTLLNGFESDLSVEDRTRQIGIRLAHFKLVNEWTESGSYLIDKALDDKYFFESVDTVRAKFFMLSPASFIVQPIGLTLNVCNKTIKIALFAHFWNPGQGKYSFTARLAEWAKDLFVVVATPLILIGLLFSAFYGAICPDHVYDARKLYASFERLAYSGGYQRFGMGFYGGGPHNYVIAPCFQPDPQAHLGGGQLGEIDAW